MRSSDDRRRERLSSSGRSRESGRLWGRRVRRLLASVLYWFAVLAISFALLVGPVLFLESRDESEVDDGNGGGTRSAAPVRLG